MKKRSLQKYVEVENKVPEVEDEDMKVKVEKVVIKEETEWRNRSRKR